MSVYRIAHVLYTGCRNMRPKKLFAATASNPNVNTAQLEMLFTTLTSANAKISNPQTKINFIVELQQGSLCKASSNDNT